LKRLPLLLAAACATHVAVQRWVAGPVVSPARLTPVLARRDQCLVPPYTLPNDEPKLMHGLLVQPRGDGLVRELYVFTPTGPTLDPDGLLSFRERNQRALHAIQGVESSGLSGCPTREGPVPCLHLELTLCARTLDQLTADLRALVDADVELKGKQLTFHVTLVGAAGPRCEADDQRCRPEPYEAVKYEPAGRRGVLPGAKNETQCQWDGECKRSGCGNACVVWTEAHRPGTCDKRDDLVDALCGCVDRRCAWFVQ
jgi:hypothetical protein